jgi:AcrR family transcriptional regulator
MIESPASLTAPGRAWSSAKRMAGRRRYHHGDVPRALVAAAVTIVERDGPEALTLREVASAIGVSHGAAYRHFADKNGILAAVAEEGYRALAKRLATALGADPRAPRARLRGLTSEYVAFALDHPALYRLMSGPRLNEDGVFPSLEAAIADAFAIVIREIERGQEERVFKNGIARDLAVTTWFTAHGFVDLVLRRRIKVKSKRVAIEYFERLFEPTLDGLRANDANETRGEKR